MPIAIKNSIIDISSEETTKELAKNFSNYLTGGEVIFLYGEMGVGKTTFVKYLINQFQIKKKLQTTEVTSPTFNLLNEYETDDLIIKHYDLFRLKDKSEVKNLDLFDKNQNTITLIEWPELINKINFKWIIYGIKVSLPFFIGTILYKIIEFSGRYFLSFYHSETEVGVYTFFTSISNILFVFVQTIVIIELYPKLIKAKNIGQEEFFLTLKTFKKQIIQYSIIGIVLSIICIYPLLWFLDKTALFESVSSYLLLLVSTLFFCLSFISHYALYVNKMDLDILKATIISFIFNISLSFVIPSWINISL